MIEVLDGGERRAFGAEELLRFHGGNSPGGVAIAYQVLVAALGELGPCERAELQVRTAFGGPGARDGFACVLGDGRVTVDPSLARPELGRERERFVFMVGCGEREVTLTLRDGFVTGEFIDLARTEERTEAQERRLDVLKRELADRVLARPASEVLGP
jgi:hypothetical protein